MPINPMDIIGQLNNKPLDFGNPVQDYAQVQNLRHLMLQGNEQERLADENQRASNVLRQSGGDLTQALPGMIKEGLFTHAQTIQKALDAGALHKSTMDLQKSKIGEQDSIAAKNKYDLNEKMFRDGIDHLSKTNNPTDFLNDLQQQVNNKTIPPEKAMELRSQIPEDIPTFNNVFKPKLIESMMSMADRYKAANPTPQVVQEHLGDTNVLSTVEPKSGVKKVISTSPMGIPPGTQARIDNPSSQRVQTVTIADPANPNQTLVINANTREVIGVGPKLTQTGQANFKQATTMQGLGADLQKAEDLLTGTVRDSEGNPTDKKANIPTGSGAGSLFNKAAGFVGMSPSGAAEADALKVVAGRLVQKVPRFEGPQSDKDVALYKSMAADVGNDNIPVARRIKSLQEMRDIYQGYENGSRGKLVTDTIGVTKPTTVKTKAGATVSNW